MSELRLWPFLCAAGRRAGYRVVLSPEFLHSQGRDGLLWRVTAGDPAAAGDLLAHHVQDEDAGDFWVVFHAARARSGDGADLEPGTFLLDVHSRPVYLTEGIVVTGGHLTMAEAQRNIELAAPLLRSVFLEFWQADDPKAQARVSLPFAPGETPPPVLDAGPAADPLPVVARPRDAPPGTALPAQPAPPESGRAGRGLLVASAILAAVIAAGALALLLAR